ncbi:MFS transporter, putative [Beauveria bassiana ARSEF 2860]|uniref:MFS transporter, putative n=1 Tax=Beauveria bassiana (strain ARSEF 2860) TaxID=655819 RepID=J5JGB3_BEAB2|nr:MFS transporter, putative [Beauveria bassiana ARSEF 2860]EJP62611.1 MFS transporter, putative [Beauveria bassiana ARSEF 2860]
MDPEANASSTVAVAKSAGPDSVDWDGPKDPAHPRNWTKGTKQMHVLIISVFTLYSNLAAVMFAPGAPQLVKEFGITSNIVASFTVSIYILGYVFGPLFLSSMSELYGRLVVYHTCNAVYMAFTIGCALSSNAAMFLVFRFICGCAASAPMVVGGGTIADLYIARERGKAMALFALGPLLGPVIGPVIGGFVTERLGWRWTFWIILILAGIVTVTALILMTDEGDFRTRSSRTQSCARTFDKNRTPTQLLARASIRPLRMLFLSPVVFLLSLYTAFMFGLIYLLFTTFPGVFEITYHFATETSGLAYLGLGIGMIVSIVLFAVLSDKLLHQPREGKLERPELRLILMMWSTPVIPIGFFWYGWSADKVTHWIVPILGTLVIGLGAFLTPMPAQLYLVDAFGAEAAASALAANTVLRSLFGALLPLAGPAMYEALGLGWGNSLLAFITLAFCPIPFLFYKYGEGLRTKFPISL